MEIDAGPDLVRELQTAKPEIVFNALHGRWGEDGNVQGLLNLLQVPYTHSGLLASALAMDKVMAKRLFGEAGLRCPEGRISDRQSLLAGDPLPRPFVVKPVREGSSMGVVIVRQGDNALPFSRSDWPFGEEVLVEPYIQGRELTVSVMEERALAVTELRPRQGFYDYEAKYESGDTRYRCPSDLDEKSEARLAGLCLEAFQVLGTSGWGRVDLMLDNDDQAWLLEVNTTPGMTDQSLMPMAARAAGIEFEELVWRILETSLNAG